MHRSARRTVGTSACVMAFMIGMALLFAPCAGCRPAKDDELRATVEELGARLDTSQTSLRSLETTLAEFEGVSKRLDDLDRRIEEMTEAHLDLHDDAVEQILRLRDHMTLQFGKMRKDSESKRLRGLAAGDLDSLRKMLADGGVRLDLDAKTVRVDGSICLTQGLIEFLAVGHGGKDHESLLYLDCLPSLLNASFLALGLEGGEPAHVEPKRSDSPAGGVPYGPEEDELLYYPPSGPSIYVYVEWGEGESRVRKRAEELVVNQLARETMSPVGWVYLGSRFAPDDRTGEELYVADITRDLIAVWHSYKGNAILDSPLPEGMGDDVFVPNKEVLPERGTPVEILFTLEPLQK